MPAFLIKLETIVRRSCIVGMVVSCTALLLILLIGTIDAITSNTLSRPFPSALELSEVLLAVAVFAALPYTQTIGQHVRVDLFTARLQGRAQEVVKAFGELATLVAMALMCWQAWRIAEQSVAMRETAAALYPFPIYPAKIAMVAGLALTVVEAARLAVRLAVGRPLATSATER